MTDPARRAAFGWENVFDDGAISAGSAISAGPVSNLAQPVGDAVWQTAQGVTETAGGAWVQLDAGSAVNWGAIGIFRTNLTAAAQVRFLLGAEQALTLPGASGSYASTPDSAALDITGDLVLVARVQPDAWLVSSQETLVGKWNTGGNNRSFVLVRLTTSRLRFFWSTDGGAGTVQSADSERVDLTTGVQPGEALWLAVSLDVNNGAGGHTVSFHWSKDGAAWQPLGAPVTGSGTTSIHAGGAALAVGAHTAGATAPFSGQIYQALVYSGLGDGLGGTLVAAMRANNATPGDSSWASPSTGETWTLQGDAEIVRHWGLDHDSGWLSGVVPGVQQLLHLPEGAPASRFLRIEIDDPANPDDHIKVGQAYGGPLWRPGVGMALGAEFGPEALQNVVESRGGQEYVQRRWSRRAWSCQFDALNDAELYDEVLEIVGYSDLGGNVLMIPRPAAGRTQQDAIYGRLQTQGRLSFTGFRTRGWRFVHSERL